MGNLWCNSSSIQGSAIGVERNVTSILAMPILTGDKKILGVVEIINKKGEDRFDRNDESLFEVCWLFACRFFFNLFQSMICF